MKRLINYFLQGLIYLAPIALVVWVAAAVFTTIDGWLGLPVPGIGFLAVIVLVTGLGFLLSNFLTRRILAAVESVLDRLPFVKLLHTSMKDLMSAFVGEKRRFDKPVVVDLDAAGGVKLLGFITRTSLEDLALGDDVAVYLPQAYNFAGQLVIVKRERVRPLALDSAAVMALIVSGGVTEGAKALAEKAAPR